MTCRCIDNSHFPLTISSISPTPFSSANKFEVTVDFLLQQVAWLTERHASQVRAQMRKAAAAAKGSAAPSPQPGPEGPFSAAAEPMRRTGSGDRQTRAPSALSIRKDSPLPRNDGSLPGTPMRSTPRPVATRTSSSNTAVYTTRNLGGSGKAPTKSSAAETQRRRLSSLPVSTAVDDQDPDPPSPSPAESSDDDDDQASSSSSSSPAQSRIIRRPPRFQGNDPASSFADDDEEDVEPAFLPYRPQSEGSSTSGGPHDLSATLRGDPRNYSRRHLKGSAGRERIHQSQTSDSSTSSATTPLKSVSSDGQSRPSAGPLSPRRTMELAGRSPGGKGKGYSRDSDGTPSMGSSFSDLDGIYLSSLFFQDIPFFSAHGLLMRNRRIRDAVRAGRSAGEQDAGRHHRQPQGDYQRCL